MAEIQIAMCLLDVVLGRDWLSRKVVPQARHDEWMQNRLRHQGISSVVRGHRVVRLANALFTLMNPSVAGIDILRNRFHTRPTKSCFIEAEIASLLKFNGFKVEIIGESGVRGKDFDLAVSKDEIALNVEVTGKDGVPFTVKTITNTLKSKRTQIPSTLPAVLYMHVPSAWMRNVHRAQSMFTEAFVDFFKRSHRLNGIILVWEQVVPLAHAGIPQMTFWACYNNNPRHPFDRWDLFDPRVDSRGRPAYAMSFYDWLKGVRAKYQTKS